MLDATQCTRLDADQQPVTDGSAKHVAVIDNRTALMWAVGYATSKAVPQKKAEVAAAEVRLFGYDDWRLPTREELLTLVDDTRFDPATNVELFPGTKSDWHWTSSPWAASPDDCAWVVAFYGGGAGYGSRDYGGVVRAVRSVARAGQ